MERTTVPKDAIRTYSEMIGRAMLFSRLGTQSFEGNRDIYKALGYPKDLRYSNYVTQYSRQDIAKAIINRPAKATWKGSLRLFESKDAKETEFEEAWVNLEKRLKLKSKFQRLDRLTCLGEYGILLLGFEGTTTEGMKNAVTGSPKLLYVNPLGESAATVDTWVKDTKNSRFGLPEIYKITLAGLGEHNTTEISMQVHHSRVIHVVYDNLESETNGTPVLKGVFNRLLDLEKLVGGSAEMFWRGARPGYQGKVDENYQMTDEMEADLKAQIDEYENSLRRIFVNEGVDFKELATQISDPGPHVDVQIQMISAETGIPKRVLTGSERGELSSSQDEDTWLSLIGTRREDFAEPQIIRPFVEMCIKYKILPAVGEDGWSVLWSDLFAKSEKDQAEVGRIRATALREYTLNPYAVEVVPPNAFFEFFLGLSQEQINFITEMEKQAVTIDSAGQETPEEMAIRKAKDKERRSQTKIARTK